MEGEDKHQTAFTVGNMRFFECNRMAFWLTNALAMFQRLMERCMAELNSKNVSYFLTTYWYFPKRSRNTWNHWKQSSVDVFKFLKTNFVNT